VISCRSVRADVFLGFVAGQIVEGKYDEADLCPRHRLDLKPIVDAVYGEAKNAAAASSMRFRFPLRGAGLLGMTGRIGSSFSFSEARPRPLGHEHSVGFGVVLGLALVKPSSTRWHTHRRWIFFRCSCGGREALRCFPALDGGHFPAEYAAISFQETSFLVRKGRPFGTAVAPLAGNVGRRHGVA